MVGITRILKDMHISGNKKGSVPYLASSSDKPLVQGQAGSGCCMTAVNCTPSGGSARKASGS